jgi:formylmethanofuran dehydrogenase subunit E
MNKCHKCGERFGTLYVEMTDEALTMICRRCKEKDGDTIHSDKQKEQQDIHR